MKHFVFLLCLALLNFERVSLDMSTNFNIKFEALKPRGIRITLPDNGYMLVTFFGNINKNGIKNEWHIYSPRPQKKMWVLEDRNKEINLGDTINYEMSIVDKSGLRFPIKGQWVVTNFTEYEETPNCVISKTELQCGKKICSGSLIFSEDFSDFMITNLTQWQFEKYYPQDPDYPFNIYLSEAVTILDEGKVKIKAMPTEPLITGVFIDRSSNLNNINSCTGEIATSECYRTLSGYYIEPPVITGKITTRKSFNFKYGRVEVRAKLPIGSWLIPEINLEPRDHEYGKLRYGSGVIRIALSNGNLEHSDSLYGGPTVHDKEPQRSRFLANLEGDNSWSNDFHTYAIIWRPGSFEMMVDGGTYGVFNSSISYPYNMKPIEPHIQMQQAAWKQGGKMPPFDKMFYISLGLRVGGIHDFRDTDDKPWKNLSPKAMHEFAQNKKIWYPTWYAPELVVDYVKVYAL